MALKKIHHLRIGTPDIENTERFASDFGLMVTARRNGVTFFKTQGPECYSYVVEKTDTPKLISIAFMVDSLADLEAAVTDKGASPITEIDAIGGGKSVSLYTPDQLRVDLVFGIEEGDPAYSQPELVHNIGYERNRHGLPQHRRAAAPAELFRLGHVGLFTPDVLANRQWFIDVLGLLPTDDMYIGSPDNVVACFMRLNRGQEWVDHHAVALFGGPGAKSDLHHASFEVADYEAQFMAHRYLQTQQWESIWGVGRHPLGSHVFDLWRDPNRYRLETFSDTDLFNANQPQRLHDALKQEIDLWSPPGPVDRYFA